MKGWEGRVRQNKRQICGRFSLSWCSVSPMSDYVSSWVMFSAPKLILSPHHKWFQSTLEWHQWLLQKPGITFKQDQGSSGPNHYPRAGTHYLCIYLQSGLPDSFLRAVIEKRTQYVKTMSIEHIKGHNVRILSWWLAANSNWFAN